MTEMLPLKLRRRIAGECRRGCGADAIEGSDYCREHHESEKAYKRASAARRRDTLRKARKCIVCERPSRKLRCRPCHKRHVVAEAERRGVASERSGVESLAPIPDRTWRAGTHERDRNTLRYHGRVIRGAPSHATLDEQDLEYAAEALAKAKAGFEVTQGPAVLGLSKIQRDAADRAWLALLDLAERFFDDIRARHRIGT